MFLVVFSPFFIAFRGFIEIEERLNDAIATRNRLLTIKKAAMDELAALESVKQVDEARSSLSKLKRQILISGEDDESLAEIRRLEQFIAEHSKRAEAAITESYHERFEATQGEKKDTK